MRLWHVRLDHLTKQAHEQHDVATAQEDLDYLAAIELLSNGGLFLNEQESDQNDDEAMASITEQERINEYPW